MLAVRDGGWRRLDEFNRNMIVRQGTWENMSGPIVRSGPSKVYSSNWDSVFGGKKAKAKEASPKKKATVKKKATKKKG